MPILLVMRSHIPSNWKLLLRGLVSSLNDSGHYVPKLRKHSKA